MSVQKIVVDLFDSWAQDGRDAEMQDGHEAVVRQAIDRMKVAPGEHIVDLGCGNGWAARLLAGANEGVEVVGVDAAPQMIDRARTTDVTVTNAAYHVAGFDDLPIGDDWADRVFSMEALYYAADLDCAIAEIRRVLVPGGWAEILIDYFEESPASEPWAEVTGADLHRLSEAGWRARFRTAGFDPVTLSRVYDPRPVDASPCDECEPTLEAKIALREAGTLWIRATKPAEVL